MICVESRKFLHAYLDGELDLKTSLDFEEHIQTCPNCSDALKGFQSLREKMKVGLYFKMPEGFETNLSALVRKKNRPIFSLKWAYATAAAVVLIFAVKTVPHLNGQSQEQLLSQQVLTSHLRSLMANHLIDVASTDQHTVKPWFGGKINFAPPVSDYADHGYKLLGGRLDYLDKNPVAALIYQRRKHLINLYVWPSNGKSETTGSRSDQGYNIFHWTESEMNYWVVSDLNGNELQEFVKLLQGH